MHADNIMTDSLTNASCFNFEEMGIQEELFS